MILAIDLGTSRTRIYKKREGVVFDEPTVLCREGKRYLYFGERVLEIRGRLHKDMEILFPLQRGLIEDPDLALAFLLFCFSSLGFKPSWKPDIYTCLPLQSTSIYHNIYRKVFKEAGFRKVVLLNPLVSVSMGLQKEPLSSQGTFLVHIGAGCTDIGLVSMRDVVCGLTLSLGSNDINGALQDTVYKKIGVKIGWETAENIKKQISCFRSCEPVRVCGVHEPTGLPVELMVSSEELIEAFGPFLSSLFRGVREVLSQVPPEFCSDIYDRGILLSGGGAALRDLDIFMSRFFNLPVFVAEDSQNQVILGLGQCVERASYRLFSLA